MGRRPRIQAAGLYHVSTHAVADTWLFFDEDDYARRLAFFADAVTHHRLRCHAFCLLRNHDHFLLGVEHDCLANVMQRLNRGYAGSFNRRHGRRGHVFASPYFSVLVTSEAHMLEVVRYIALNPEFAGLGRAEDYRWSSYPSLVGFHEPVSFVDPTPLLAAVGGGRYAAREIANLVAAGRVLGKRRGSSGV
jgi:REP element-mobilizing transposase RayT